MTSKEDILAGLEPVDRAALVDALTDWKNSGVENPMIALDYDADGDGSPDAWALDENGELVLVTVDSISETVSESDGTGVELGGDGGEE